MRAAVVADLLQNFNGPSGKESVNYKQNRYEILLSQINRLPQSAHKFEAKTRSFQDIYPRINFIGNVRGYLGLIKNYFTMDKRGMLFRPPGTVIHKSVFNEVGFFDERIDFGEDIDLNLRVLLKYDPAFYNRNVSFYRVDAENNVKNKIKPIDRCFFYYMEKFSEERARSITFRKYYDRITLALMSHHLLYGMSKNEVSAILNEVDFSLQPFKWRLLYTFPKLYRWYEQFLK